MATRARARPSVNVDLAANYDWYTLFRYRRCFPDMYEVSLLKKATLSEESREYLIYQTIAYIVNSMIFTIGYSSIAIGALRIARGNVLSRYHFLVVSSSHLNHSTHVRQWVREVERRSLSVLVDQPGEVREVDRGGRDDAEVTAISFDDRRMCVALPEPAEVLVGPFLIVLLDVDTDDPVLPCDIKRAG